MASELFYGPKFRAFDSNGSILDGAKLYFYLAGTSGHEPVFQDAARGSQHTQPVVADASGVFAHIFLNPEKAYKVELYDKNDVLQWSVDNYDNTIDADYLKQLVNDIISAETSAGLSRSDLDFGFHVGHPRRYKMDPGGVNSSTSNAVKWLNVGKQGVTLTTGDYGDVYLMSGWTMAVATTFINMIGTGGLLKSDGNSAFLEPGVGGRFNGARFENFERVFYADDNVATTAEELIVLGCHFKNIQNNTINHQGRINSLIVAENKFEDCKDIVIRCGNDDETISDDYWHNQMVVNNVCDGITASATDRTVAFYLGYGRRAVASNNIVREIDPTTSVAPAEGWGIYLKVIEKTVNGNVISFKSGIATTVNLFGINLKGDPRDKTASPQGYNGVVSGNTIEMQSLPKSKGIQGASEDILITGNHVDNAQQGIRILGGDTATDEDHSDIHIIGNNINANYATGTADSVGILLNCFGKRYKIHGNYIRSADLYGIRMLPSSGKTIQYLNITDNVIEGSNVTDQGVRFDQTGSSKSTDVVIRGNEIRRCTTAIREAGTTSCLENATIEENDIFDVTNYWSFANQVPGLQGSQKGIKLQTTDGTAVNLISFEPEDDTGTKLTATAMAHDPAADEMWTASKFAFYVSPSGTPAQKGITQNIYSYNPDSMGLGGLTLDLNSDKARAQIAGKTATTIDWIAEFEVRTA